MQRGSANISKPPHTNKPGANENQRATGIEPAWPAWKAGTLPLSYARAPGIKLALRSCNAKRFLRQLHRMSKPFACRCQRTGELSDGTIGALRPLSHFYSVLICTN